MTTTIESGALQPSVVPESVLLRDEVSLPPQEIHRRVALGARILEHIPDAVNVLGRTQITQLGNGCGNQCGFCSQQAGATSRELTGTDVRTIFGGIKGAMESVGLDQIGSDLSHKPGVMFPYMDNDIGSNRSLGDLVEGVASLNGRTRLSTVGWSRHNPELQAMHDDIARNKQGDVDGIRMSFTPYTLGWRRNREEYVADFANVMNTYKPLLEARGPSRRGACVEMRFRPDVMAGELEQTQVGKYHVIKSGDYGLVTFEDLDTVPITAIDSMHDGKPVLTNEGVTSLQLLGEVDGLSEEDFDELFDILPEHETQSIVSKRVMATKGNAHRSNNYDGDYYSFEPLLTDESQFLAVQYYPKSATRTESGVLDTSRPLLNTITAYKEEVLGRKPRDSVEEASEADVQSVRSSLYAQMEALRDYSPHRAEYIEREVLPLVDGVISALSQSQLDPSYFFTHGFIVDTGVIVNQGKAWTEFDGLSSATDYPMTLNEEKGFGLVSDSSERGISWRIAPVPILASEARTTSFGPKSEPIVIGRKEQYAVEPPVEGADVALGFYALSPICLSDRLPDGTVLPVFQIPLDSQFKLRSVTPLVARREYLIPGLSATEDVASRMPA